MHQGDSFSPLLFIASVVNSSLETWPMCQVHSLIGNYLQVSQVSPGANPLIITITRKACKVQVHMPAVDWSHLTPQWLMQGPVSPLLCYLSVISTNVAPHPGFVQHRTINNQWHWVSDDVIATYCELVSCYSSFKGQLESDRSGDFLLHHTHYHYSSQCVARALASPIGGNWVLLKWLYAHRVYCRDTRCLPVVFELGSTSTTFGSHSNQKSLAPSKRFLKAWPANVHIKRLSLRRQNTSSFEVLLLQLADCFSRLSHRWCQPSQWHFNKTGGKRKMQAAAKKQGWWPGISVKLLSQKMQVTFIPRQECKNVACCLQRHKAKLILCQRFKINPFGEEVHKLIMHICHLGGSR